MPKKIEEIFDPERLRKNWEKSKSKKLDETPVQAGKKAQMPALDALVLSLHEHFYGDNLAVLNLLIDSLRPVWESLFAGATRENSPAVDAEKMIAAAHELLNKIEDLSFAFSYGNGAGRT